MSEYVYGGIDPGEIQRVLPAEVEQHRLEHERRPITMPWPTNLFETIVWTNSANSAKPMICGKVTTYSSLKYCSQLVVVVAGDRLHGDADEHRHREQHELHERDRRELREPVGRLAHRQRVVDAVEMVVALAPDQLPGVQRGDDVEEQRRAAFHRLQHQVRDGPDVHRPPTRPANWPLLNANTISRPTIAQKEISRTMRADTQARERQVLRERRARAEDLAYRAADSSATSERVGPLVLDSCRRALRRALSLRLSRSAPRPTSGTAPTSSTSEASPDHRSREVGCRETRRASCR